MKISIITTTIHKPVLLEQYCLNLKKYGHQPKQVNFIVIGDKKTPAEVGGFCQNLSRKEGFEILYYDVPGQLKYLERFPKLSAHLPFNSVMRRNIAFVLAYEQGVDVAITIDDDNFVTDSDFVSLHEIAGKQIKKNAVFSNSGWFNICQLLVEERNQRFYHRGYPMGQRTTAEAVFETKVAQGRVAVNAGLWLEEPDIDAVTRRDSNLRVLDATAQGKEGILLDFGTWSPFNSQNTAVMRDAIPAYFLSPYVGRYDDIWASYFLRKIVDHLGDYTHYGPPLVQQVRNQHDLNKDLSMESRGMEMTDRLVGLLRDIQLSKKDYASCYEELTMKIRDVITRIDIFNEAEAACLKVVLDGMNIWSETFRLLHENRKGI